MAQYWTDRQTEADSQGTPWRNGQLLASMVSAPAPTGFLTASITASAAHWLHLSSGCGRGPDEVLKVYCANEYGFEDEVLNELTKLQLEG